MSMQEWVRCNCSTIRNVSTTDPVETMFCGPIRPVQVEAMRCFLAEIITFKEVHAEKAAELFELVGRKRSLKIDAMIAATAILMKAPLATNNISDFEQFAQLGLELYQV